MTDRRAIETFETRFAGRVRAYTDVATARRIDALAVSRTAMSSRRASGWSEGSLGTGPLRRRSVGVRWAVASVAVVLIGVVGVGVLGRPSISSAPSPAASTGGPIPDVLRHSWQRPLPVAPGPDLGGSGFLNLASGQLEFGRREPGSATSRSGITATGLDAFAVTATVETIGCAIGDLGAYRWLVEGKGTVMTLTAIGTDACAPREEALAGPWVRSDLPISGGGEATLPPGTYVTSAFDPFDKPGVSEQLSYTVPEGWKVKEDRTATFVLHHLPDAPQGQPSTDSFVVLLAQPRMAADFRAGVACGPVGDAPGVGGGLDDLVAAITARPGVVSTPPAALTIGGYEGQLLDLQLAASWTGGCLAPEGLIVGVPILQEAGSSTGPVVGLGPDHPVRLILLDLADGRTMAVVIDCVGPSQSSSFEQQVVQVMPIIESFEFHPPTP
jgi:hypothetical protein